MPGIGTIDQVVANLPLIFLKEGFRLYNNQALMIKKARKVKGRGGSLNWTVSNGGNPVLYRGPGYTVNPATDVINYDRVKLTLNRGIVSASFGFTDDELATVQSYLGTDAISEAVRDLFGEAYTEHLSALMRQLEVDSLTGTGTATAQGGGTVNSIVGFITALTSSSYGGEAIASNPGLAATVNPCGNGGLITREQLRIQFAEMKQKTGHNPQFIMASPLTCTYLNVIGDSQIRYPARESNLELMQQNRPGVPMHDSITSVFGVPVFENTAWGMSNGVQSNAANADGYVLFGNWDKFKYDILTYTVAQDAMLSAIKEGLSIDPEEVEPVGVPVRCWAQAKTAASIVVNMDLAIGLQITEPNSFGLITGVVGGQSEVLNTHSV